MTTTDVGRQPEHGEILDDLAAGGALAGDDQRIVIGRHQNRAALCGDAAGDGLAIVAGAVVKHDFGAVGDGALALGARRIARHDDDTGHAEKPRRSGNALGVIAGRVGDDAAGRRSGGMRGELVIGAAKLERAGTLQRLGFEKNPAAGHARRA